MINRVSKLLLISLFAFTSAVAEESAPVVVKYPTREAAKEFLAKYKGDLKLATRKSGELDDITIRQYIAETIEAAKEQGEKKWPGLFFYPLNVYWVCSERLTKEELEAVDTVMAQEFKGENIDLAEHVSFPKSSALAIERLKETNWRYAEQWGTISADDIHSQHKSVESFLRQFNGYVVYNFTYLHNHDVWYWISWEYGPRLQRIWVDYLKRTGKFPEEENVDIFKGFYDRFFECIEKPRFEGLLDFIQELSPTEIPILPFPEVTPEKECAWILNKVNNRNVNNSSVYALWLLGAKRFNEEYIPMLETGLVPASFIDRYPKECFTNYLPQINFADTFKTRSSSGIQLQVPRDNLVKDMWWRFATERNTFVPTQGCLESFEGAKNVPVGYKCDWWGDLKQCYRNVREFDRMGDTEEADRYREVANRLIRDWAVGKRLIPEGEPE